MTGEMSQFDADHGEEWALHRSIARAIGGKIRAFDVYQGPYILAPGGGRLWIEQDEGAVRLHLTFEGRENRNLSSEPFHYSMTRRACTLARGLVKQNQNRER